MFERYRASYLVSRALLEKEDKKGVRFSLLAGLIAFFILLSALFSKTKRINKKYFNAELIQKYKNKPLAKKGYMPDGEGDYTAESFSDFDDLEYILDEINSHESDLTQDGFSFLNEYYGLSNLAQELHGHNWCEGEFDTVEKIESWLKIVAER